MSLTPTLLDPFEVASGGGPRGRLPSLSEAVTEWFDRASLPFLAVVGAVEEITASPPWTPEPVDRRWRARGWDDE